MSESVHKKVPYNFAHKMSDKVDPDQYAGNSMPYKAISRVINIVEDLHAQMQLPVGERFVDYPIESFEEVDTIIRDNMANLALSLENRALSEKGSK